jgi:penicillin-insensitive murein endopeptidase
VLPSTACSAAIPKELILRSVLLLAFSSGPALAQAPTRLDTPSLRSFIQQSNRSTPAREFFARASEPAQIPPRAIGSYSRGCLAGAVALPMKGEAWQVDPSSRDRNWGHPSLVKLLERLGHKSRQVAGWPGIFISDLSQARGGPMPDGHVSHQSGLEADIWLMPMPSPDVPLKVLEEMPAPQLVDKSGKDVDASKWTPGHGAVIRAAAEEDEVALILVNAAIKKALCRETSAKDRGWLRKLVTATGHDGHFHIRLRCPPDSPGCSGQAPVGGGDGCGSIHFPPELPPRGGKSRVTMDGMPAACKQVLLAP